MRLIDANILIEEIKSLEVTMGGQSLIHKSGKDSIINLIEQQPTIDAEPVVRCKDCKHRNKEYGEEFCEVLGRLTNDKFYCSYGAKMDEVQE